MNVGRCSDILEPFCTREGASPPMEEARRHLASWLRRQQVPRSGSGSGLGSGLGPTEALNTSRRGRGGRESGYKPELYYMYEPRGHGGDADMVQAPRQKAHGSRIPHASV